MEQDNKQPAIIFDYGGVLLDWNPRYLYRQMFDGDEDEMETFLSTVCSPEWNVQLDEGRSFAEAIGERILQFPAYASYIQAYHDRWAEMVGGAIIGTVQVLSALREQGYPLFALSNWSAETYPLMVQRFEFLGWFEEVVLSGRENVAKPDPAIFEVLLGRIHHRAQDCLFIDDSEANISTANALGFQTIHFTSPEHLSADLLKRKILAAAVKAADKTN